MSGLFTVKKLKSKLNDLVTVQGGQKMKTQNMKLISARRPSYLDIARPVNMTGRKWAYCPAPKFLPASSISSPSRRMRARHNRQKFKRNFSSRSLYSPWSNRTAKGQTARICSNSPSCAGKPSGWDYIACKNNSWFKLKLHCLLFLCTIWQSQTS